MVSSVFNSTGTGRSGDFARTNEYIFFVRIGSATVDTAPDPSALGKEVSWETMRRRNLASVRGRRGKGACGPNQFYPIFVDVDFGRNCRKVERPFRWVRPDRWFKPQRETVAAFL